MHPIPRIAALAVAAAGLCAAQALPANGANRFYTGNRAPLAPNPLIKLPLGAVRPEGWLRRQLALEAGGFSGKLEEISQFCKYPGNGWTSPTGQGPNGWEEVPYWLRGYVDLGYLLGDPTVIAHASQWLNAVLASQRANGYFGSQSNLTNAERSDNLPRRGPDLWPNMVMMFALRSFYEATGDARVIPFLTKYFRWQTTIPLTDFLPGSWQKWRGGDNLDSIYWLYNRTGDRWLLDLARVNHERTADWSGGIASWHNVNFAECFREPAQFFQQSMDARYLNATVRNYDDHARLYGQVPGGGYAADENARPGFNGPRNGTETCAWAELMFSDEILVGITGDRHLGRPRRRGRLQLLPCLHDARSEGSALHHQPQPGAARPRQQGAHDPEHRRDVRATTRTVIAAASTTRPSDGRTSPSTSGWPPAITAWRRCCTRPAR